MITSPEQARFMQGVKNEMKNRRERLGLSLNRAGMLAGVTQAHWAMWEDGRRVPRLDQLPAIARALRCDPRDLVA